MQKFYFILALPLVLLAVMAIAVAGEDYGTPEEAKAMLEKAVAEVNKDQDAAFKMFIEGEGDYKHLDLYVYCGGPDGNFTAHPKLVGKSLKDLKDKSDKALGEEIYTVAEEGKIAEVAYMWPRPGETEPVEKVAYVTKVKDQICAVGYYKQ